MWNDDECCVNAQERKKEGFSCGNYIISSYLVLDREYRRIVPRVTASMVGGSGDINNTAMPGDPL